MRLLRIQRGNSVLFLDDKDPQKHENTGLPLYPVYDTKDGKPDNSVDDDTVRFRIEMVKSIFQFEEEGLGCCYNPVPYNMEGAMCFKDWIQELHPEWNLKVEWVGPNGPYSCPVVPDDAVF